MAFYVYTYIQTQGSIHQQYPHWSLCCRGSSQNSHTSRGSRGRRQEGNFRVLQREWVLGMGTDSLRTIGSEDEEEEQKVFRVRWTYCATAGMLYIDIA